MFNRNKLRCIDWVCCCPVWLFWDGHGCHLPQPLVLWPQQTVRAAGMQGDSNEQIRSGVSNYEKLQAKLQQSYKYDDLMRMTMRMTMMQTMTLMMRMRMRMRMMMMMMMIIMIEGAKIEDSCRWVAKATCCLLWTNRETEKEMSPRIALGVIF